MLLLAQNPARVNKSWRHPGLALEDGIYVETPVNKTSAPGINHAVQDPGAYMSWDVGRNSPLQAFFFCHLKTGICGHLWTGCPTLHEPSQRQSTLRFTKHVSLHDFH